jgi:MprA protease rhombosortase-interaction domain-containing protein
MHLCISRRPIKFLSMIPAIVLMLVAVAYRITTGLLIVHSGATWLSNFVPFAALALCGGVYFPGKLKFALPLGALFISDVILNYGYGASLVDPHTASRYVALALVGLLGYALRRRASLKTLLPASLLGSAIFYLITNVFAWLSDPGYAKTPAALVQALTVGLPQYSATPAWMFFRNSVISDLLFTLLFVVCMSFGLNTASARAAATLPRPA